jgi:predicted RNA-binding protein with PUA-like domain
MAHWLLKTEPSEYSFERLEREGKATWDGVANPVAVKNLKSARKGDEVVVYHTGNVKAAVGVAEVTREDPASGLIEIAARRKLSAPVTLAALKAHKLFADSPLVRQGRLSVVPLTDAQYEHIVGG